MTTGFPGFAPEARDIFCEVARNNRREWFQPRKPAFEPMVKQPTHQLAEAIHGELRRFASEYVTDPAKAVFRIYRDTRFSKDQSPYKTHIAACFPHRELGGAGSKAGFYFAVSHKEVAIGGGMYLPSRDAAGRAAHLAEHHRELRRLLAAKSVRSLLGELQGERRTRVPKGWAADHSAAKLLRYEQLFLYIELAPEFGSVASYPEGNCFALPNVSADSRIP